MLHKALSPRLHGVFDYLAVLAFVLAPSVLGFQETRAAILSYVAAVLYAGLSILTDYPLGIVKVTPFMIHGAVEAFAAFFFIAAPWLFRFWAVPAARDFFIVSGAVLGLVWLLTHYKAADYASGRLGRAEKPLPRRRPV